MSQKKMNRKERWRIALHEAGHHVAFRAESLWDTECSATVRLGGGYATPPDGLSDSAYAVGIAAGAHAEKLARRFPIPDAEPIKAKTVSAKNGATAEAIRAAAVDDARFESVKRGPNDAELLAPFCVKSCPGDPADWARMFSHYHRSARELVQKHADEIRRVATILYKSGRYVHEGDPADNDFFPHTAGKVETTQTGGNTQ